MTNLYDQIKEEEANLTNEEVKEEVQVEEEEQEEVSTDVEGESEGDTEDESEDEESDGLEEESKEEMKPDASAYARMRREKRDLEKRIAELEKAKEPVVEVEDNDPQPSKEDNYEDWLEWRDRQIESKVQSIEKWKLEQEQAKQHNDVMQGAIKEFQQYESSFKKEAPDYEQAAEHLKRRLQESISIADDDLSPAQVDEKVKNYILKNAAQAAADGYNPAEALYRMSKERFGYSKSEEKEAAKRTPLKKIDANKRMSASPLQSGGKAGSVSLTKEAVASMSMAEFAKLTPSQIRELEAQ